LHVEHPCLKHFAKKKEVKEAKPKGRPRILMPQREQQNLARGTNLGGKLDGAQAEHL